MKVYCDTSVLVAASLRAYPRHASAKASLVRIHCREDFGYASSHTLAETFSVLTRIPTQPKLASLISAPPPVATLTPGN